MIMFLFSSAAFLSCQKEQPFYECTYLGYTLNPYQSLGFKTLITYDSCNCPKYYDSVVVIPGTVSGSFGSMFSIVQYDTLYGVRTAFKIVKN